MPRGDNQNRPSHFGESMQAPTAPPAWEIVDSRGVVVASLWSVGDLLAKAFAEGMMSSPAGSGLGVLRTRKVEKVVRR